MNLGGAKSATGTPHSVTETISMETDQLLTVAAQEEFGKQKQEAFKRLVHSKMIKPFLITDDVMT
jgi:hypothetical protein